jgi:hypothetical protein
LEQLLAPANLIPAGRASRDTVAPWLADLLQAGRTVHRGP